MWSQSRESLERVLGLGSPVADLLINAHDASVESFAGELAGLKLDPFAPALRQYLISSMGGLPDERLRILFLDGAQQLIADEELQHGTLAHLVIHPRTIFRRALELNAANIILVHNHPSGDASPSAEDVHATRVIEQVGRALDVHLVDHIVVASTHVHHIVNREPDVPQAGGSSFSLRSPDPLITGASPDPAFANALVASRRRLLRLQLLAAPELFGDPAWEMLIDLFIHERQQKDLSISALCVPVGLPMSSALRLVQKLCDAGLVRRIRDPIDGRRSIIRLMPATSRLLAAYFAAGSE